MGLFTGWFYNFFSKNRFLDIKSDFIFYKIVDSFVDDDYMLQCINTSALFRSKIADIVFDIDILYGLHPIQACYVGLAYAKYIKQITREVEIKKIEQNDCTKYSTSRYGKYHLLYQNRSGELSFINVITNDYFIMDARDIALTEELISEFDASQAFYIGLIAGMKIINPTKNIEFKQPYLRILK
jgi:hypothetical protein